MRGLIGAGVAAGMWAVSAAALAASATAPALKPAAVKAAPANAGWTRTYVIEWYEPAMYYGAKAGTVDPGTDCAAGANPSPDWVKVLTANGYSEKDAKWLRDPANPTHSPINGQPMMAFRGDARQNVYDFPTTAKEVGLPPVTGKIAEGLNLDGDEKTGFTSPTGEKGIDNNFYKALGCWKTYRGPHRMSSGAQGQNDGMREGGWTVVVVASGKGADPMNDKDVEIGFYPSADKIVRDGMGNVAKDYTFAIKPDRVYEAVFKGSTVGGRLKAKAVGPTWMRNPGYDKDLQLLKAQVDMQLKPDGSMTGLMGGYRPWLPVYKGWVAGRGPVIEALTWVQLPDVYYALKRYADYSPTGPGGEKTYISFAMKIDAVPAFVMEPDAAHQVASVKSYRGQPEEALARAVPAQGKAVAAADAATSGKSGGAL